ncbi:MAG: enoyl-CoA hydratase-related protein [Candidatus Dormibacteraceae bacterium]
MNYDQIRLTTEGAACIVTLSRPERLNAFTDRMRDELIDALKGADADDRVRAVIVTGAGRAFCAGADLDAGAATFDQGPGPKPDTGGTVTLAIARMRKPVIAAVNGAAVGVGVTMTLGMDFRLAAEEARFGFIFARRGIVPEAVSSFLLPRVVGFSRAMEWTATGGIFTAAEALAAGLVRSIHPRDQLLPVALALVADIAENTSAVAVAVARQMYWEGMGGLEAMEKAHRLESRMLQVIGASADAREGVAAFMEKRAARFPMRVSADMPESVHS